MASPYTTMTTNAAPKSACRNHQFRGLATISVPGIRLYHHLSRLINSVVPGHREAGQLTTDEVLSQASVAVLSQLLKEGRDAGVAGT